MLWMFDGETLHRYATLPVGAEVTGLHIDANDTLFMNTSHPDGQVWYPITGHDRRHHGLSGWRRVCVVAASARRRPPCRSTGRWRLHQPLGRTGAAMPHSAHGHKFGQIPLADGAVTLCNRADGNMYLPTSGRQRRLSLHQL
ncbi:MAG: hypothetical protein R3A44_00135 [Caldilineaceae bacterium]